MQSINLHTATLHNIANAINARSGNKLFTRWQQMAKRCGIWATARCMAKRGYSLQVTLAILLGTTLRATA